MRGIQLPDNEINTNIGSDRHCARRNTLRGGSGIRDRSPNHLASRLFDRGQRGLERGETHVRDLLQTVHNLDNFRKSTHALESLRDLCLTL